MIYTSTNNIIQTSCTVSASITIGTGSARNARTTSTASRTSSANTMKTTYYN